MCQALFYGLGTEQGIEYVLQKFRQDYVTLSAFKGLEIILLSHRDPSKKEQISPIRLRPPKIKVIDCPHHFRMIILPENELTFYIFPVALFVPHLVLWFGMNFVLLTSILAFSLCFTCFWLFLISVVCFYLLIVWIQLTTRSAICSD